MFGHIAAFEWRYQRRNPVFWVGCLIFFLFAFLAIASDNVQIGSAGTVHKNAPFAVVQIVALMGIFSVFVTVALVANVVVRDDETGFAPIIRATSVSKASYLGGRFVGACAAAFVVLAMVPLGIWLGSRMPWVDFEKLGPSLPGDYLFALFAMGLPTLLITAAIFFAIATATRSMLWSMVCAVGLFALSFIGRAATRNDPLLEHIAALADPFGASALAATTKYWSTFERNTYLPALAGTLLVNRLLWTAVAAGVFAIGYRRFRFEQRFEGGTGGAGPSAPAGEPARPARLSRARKAALRHQDELAALGEQNPAGVREMLAAAARAASTPLPDIPPATAATARAQLWELAKVDMTFVFRSPAYYVLIAIGLMLSCINLVFGGEILGSPSWPVTRLMVQALSNGYALLPLILAIFYAGELVWRDRDRGMNEIIDATAAPDWTHLVPKVAAITAVLVSSALIAVLAAIAYQALHGFFRFQVGAYLAWFVWPMSVEAILLAVLALFVQVLVPHKYIGWAVMLVYIVVTGAMGSHGFEHNLYTYGGTPPTPLSDMNGLGRFWIGQAWFQVYWAAFATMLLVFAHALWRRGTTVALGPRLRQAARHLRGRAGATLAGAAVVWIATGAWIFYNTNVLNRYVTQPEHDQLMADVEKTLLRYEKVVQPRVADVTLDVALFPRQARAVTRGRYTLTNRSTQPISELHLQWAENLRLDEVALAGATVKTDYPRLHYRIYGLATPMQPGESRTLDFTTTLEQRGFTNGQPLTAVVPNGSFVNNNEIAPSVGFARVGLLEDRAKRRKYGLPAELRPPKLEDDSARALNVLSHDSDWVNSDITITTDGDQTPIAPGRTVADSGLVKDPDARRTVRFRSDAPINQFFSLQSGRYDIRRSVWHAPAQGEQPAHDVALAVYYTPGHEFNVDRMLKAMAESLALFSERFTPYQFGQARIVGFPAYAAFAQSFANTIPFSEDIGFVQHWTDPTKIDVATYVTAHEIGHQWWGHQLVPADQQGASMLVETFAQYSALLVMEQHYGKDQVRRFLKFELDRYLRSRGGAVLDELPLDRVEDQDYIYYRKGSVAMYWAKEALGEAVVDRAMRKLLAQFAFKGAPYANTTDFLRLLRAEAGPANDALITDLFDRITLLDLRATDAVAKKLPDGRYTVTFDVSARKFYADGAGHETEVPMAEAIEVGVFSEKPGAAGFDASKVLRFETVPIAHGVPAHADTPDAGSTSRRWLSPFFTVDHAAHLPGTIPVTLVVDGRPTWVGIDPYNKRIDRNSDDNLVEVDTKP
jgi:ABC-type transport system involved in multi-copper enzyme maturation permease subunit